jgi:hypothetical protein
MRDPEFKDEHETEQWLRVKVKTLQTWRALKKGPRFVRIGRRIFYPTAELERFIAENTVETSAVKCTALPERDRER